jgi:hypothetical protein
VASTNQETGNLQAGQAQTMLRDYGGTILVAVLVALLIRFFLI